MSIKKSILKPKEMAALFKLKLGGKKIVGQHKNDNLKNNESLIFCYDTLDKVSRSFAAVIRQLPEEISDVVCIFYLILRGLDSVEDDMDLSNEAKILLLREFYAKNFEEGWSLTNVGDKQEYRDLLANYDKVIDAFLVLDEKYQKIITEICKKMGDGMADFVESKITSIEDYNLYCHYVAGLVGIGLSELFAASEIESRELKTKEVLANSMAFFCKKTTLSGIKKRTWTKTESFGRKRFGPYTAPHLKVFP